MSKTLQTIAMGMLLPVPTEETGPAYAIELVTAFNIIDIHNHTSGFGIKFTAESLNINADLSFQSFNAELIRASRLSDNTAALSGTDDKCALSTVGGDFYYNNLTTNIHFTSGIALNGASVGAISGDYATSTASEYYSSLTKTFYFTQLSNVSANIACGDLFIYNSTFANYVRFISSAIALYNLTLPAIPVSTKMLTVDAYGVLIALYSPDNVTIELDGSNNLRLKDSSIINAKIVAPTSNFAGNASQYSVDTISANTWFTVSAFNVTLTTSGRPIMLWFTCNDSTYQNLQFFDNHSSSAVQKVYIKIIRDTTDVAAYFVAENTSEYQTYLYNMSCPSFDFTCPAGSHTYHLQVYCKSTTTGHLATIWYTNLNAREM